METKPRILYLQKILLERTDEENPLSTTQLINILNDEYGISAHRTTVTKDIAALQEFGMDIVTIHSTQSKYFVASRKFELPELKLLIDAVESSKFITKKKSETLIEKIHTMTSPGQVAKLKRNNYVVNRIKPDNEQIYYIIDAINDAINAGKQISFQYYDYTGLKKKVLKNKGEVYKLSPYKLLWCGDYYYVLGYSEKKSKVINFRVDRIASKPEILDKDIVPMPDDFDIENYTKEVFFMFSGEKVLVDLRCDNSLMKTMVDRFGEDVTTLAYDMTSFRVQTEVSASPTFFGWVFGFNGKVQILAPESVKEQYRQMISKADENMQESEQCRFELVRANYTNLQKGFHETTEYLEVFLRNLLLNEKNELYNRNLHISGLLNEEKVDIGDTKVDIENEKVDIQDKKVDIESVLSEKGSDFSVKTTIHIHRLFEKFGFDEVFGRSAVMELLELKSSGASKLLSNLVQADIIEPVSGHGKGKYKFKK